MKIVICRIGQNKTVAFAQNELCRYLRSSDPALFIDERVYDTYDPTLSDVLWVGDSASVEKSELDEIAVSVKNGCGIITGSSPRAVLIAVYRFLREIGFFFLFPGKEGDVIPQRSWTKEDLTVSVREKASYRHRSVCIEGAVSYEHIYNMVDYLPKVGMNGYFVQFQSPDEFFFRFYNKYNNPNFKFDPITREDVQHIWNRAEEEIVLRGLDYHATGHGWTCEPFGVIGSGWVKEETTAPDSIKPYLAQIDGVREYYGGVALNTNLCYSNRVARDKMNDAIVAYAKAHPAVNYLHFWLADADNNHCECDKCRTMRPSDWYVRILNELDEKLTAEGLNTKIVCLIYLDLLWAPESEKIKNPDRFVLMFAPITRTYSRAFTDGDIHAQVTLPDYKRNENKMPRTVEENLGHLRRWQTEQLSGESFDFDYHLMWDHYNDPGYYECARILHADMANMDKLGLDGMVSCQLQRCAFPTGLPMYAMARALWDKTCRFEDVCDEYFTASFGEDGKKIEAYLSRLSQLFDPVYIRNERDISPEVQIEKLKEAKKYIAAFKESVLVPNRHRGFVWNNLVHHADICQVFADAYIVYISTTDAAKREKAMNDTLELVYEREKEFHTVFDSQLFRSLFTRNLARLRTPDLKIESFEQ